MTEFEIKKAMMSQMPEIARVFSASRASNLPFLPQLHSESEDEDFFTNSVFSDNDVYIAVDVSNQGVLGFIAFTAHWINHLYLLPDHQRRGIGSKLIGVAKSKTDSLKLWTFQKNLNARQFYEMHNFRVLQSTDGSENEEREPDILMCWENAPQL